MSILMSITFQPPFSMKRASKKENELNQMKLLSFYTLFLKNSLHALNFGKIKVLKKFLKKLNSQGLESIKEYYQYCLKQKNDTKVIIVCAC